MKIQLIRNATMKIKYAGKTILTDPMFSDKGEIQSFAGIAPNPTVELTQSIQEIMENVDIVLVSHIHPDHFDNRAIAEIPKDMIIYCQPFDEKKIKDYGFINVIPITNSELVDNIIINKTTGKHGSGKILEMMGEVSGFVFKADGEPTVYWIGDSILNDEVKNTLIQYNPDYVICHSGGAVIPGFDPILMKVDETLQILELLPSTKVIAIHLDSLDHCTVTRKSLIESITGREILNNSIMVPQDGETLELF